MRIKLRNTDLIRRFGKLELDVDSSIGRLWISKGFAIDISVKNNDFDIKAYIVPPEDKMVKNAPIIKEMDTIFPVSIIGK